LQASLGWQSNGKSFNENEMALFYECTRMCAQKLLDTADIVREAMLQQSPLSPRQSTLAPGQPEI
jgi:hypothetical protein